jgi:hypothetical protein
MFRYLQVSVSVSLGLSVSWYLGAGVLMTVCLVSVCRGVSVCVCVYV